MGIVSIYFSSDAALLVSLLSVWTQNWFDSDIKGAGKIVKPRIEKPKQQTSQT